MPYIKNRETGTREFVDASNLGSGSMPTMGGPTPNGSPAGSPSMGGVMGGYEQPETGKFDTLQTLLLMQSLLDPKHASTYGSIATQVKGLKPEVDKERVEAQSDAKSKIQELDRAIESLEKKGLQTGPIQGRLIQAKVKLGGASAEERQIVNLLGRIQAEELFNIGGKTLPAQEINRLLTYLPDPSLPTETNIDNLKEIRRTLEKQSGVMSSSNKSTPGKYNLNIDEL